MTVIDDDRPPRHGEVRDECQRLYTAWESAMNVMENPSEEYSRQEIDTIEENSEEKSSG